MTIRAYCNRDVVVVEQQEPVREAINLMRNAHVGDVVVVDTHDGHRVPVGILTDRDIVLQILAPDVDLDAINIGDVMSFDLVTVDEDSSIMDAIWTLREKGVRRAPVVDQSGYLSGIITVDDLLELVAEQLSDLVGLIAIEQAHEGKRLNPTQAGGVGS